MTFSSLSTSLFDSSGVDPLEDYYLRFAEKPRLA